MRVMFLLVGLLATVLGLIGAFLPVLPTTPFLLLALACFSRSSPGMQQRLLQNPVFGPYLVQWQRDRSVPTEAKRKAYGLIIVMFGISVILVELLWLRVTLVVLACVVIAVVAALPAEGASSELAADQDE